MLDGDVREPDRLEAWPCMFQDWEGCNDCMDGNGELEIGGDVCRAGSSDGMVFNFWSGVIDRTPM